MKTYIGKGKVYKTKYGELTSINVCLDDIPNEMIEKSKNGKRYVRMTISEMREKDRYDNTHTVFVENRKQEKQDVVAPENFVDDIPW